MQKRRIGLALGGGAAKGWAHIGFLKALDEAGIRPDIIAGTSMGAVAGGCWSAGQLAKLEEFALSLTQRRVFSLMDVSLSGSGLINGSRLATLLMKNLESVQIEDLQIPFSCMATELENGNEIWLTKGDLSTALQASYALPGIFKPVKFDDRWLVDGALVNPVPITACRAMGADYVIGVSLSSGGVGRGTVMANTMMANKAHEAKAEHLPLADDEGTHNRPSAKSLLRRQMLGSKDGPPGISSVMMQSFNIIQDRIARSRLAGDPPDLLVNPTVDTIGLFDFHRADEAIDAGYHAAAPVIATLAPNHRNPDHGNKEREEERQTA